MMTTPFNPKRDSGGIGERDREGVFCVCAIAYVVIIVIALMLLPAPVMMGEARATGTASTPELRGKPKSPPSGPPTGPPPGEAPPSPPRGEGAGEMLGDVLGDVAAVGLPPGTQVEIVDLGSVTTTESGSGTGVGATAIGDKLSESFDGSAPNVGLGSGGSSSGGAAKRTGKASAFVPPEGLASNPLVWAGIACGLLAVAAAAYLKNIRAALALGGLGAAFIVAALFPGFLLLIVAGAAVVGGIVYLQSEQGRQKFLESTRALTAAIDHPDVPVDAKERIAGTLAMEADTQDKKTIAMVRAKDAPLAFAGTG